MTPKLIIFFFLAVFVFNSSAYYIDPPHQEVRQNNSDLSARIQSVFIRVNANRVATINDPITFADARILTLMPSVDERISDKNRTSVFWVYGSSYANSISGPNTRSDSRCAPGQSTLTYTSSNVNRTVIFEYRNRTKQVHSPDFFVDIPFSEAELISDREEQMNISVRGNFIFTYNRTDSYQNYVCLGFDNVTGSCSTHGCNLVTARSTVQFLKSFSNSINYTVENGLILNFLRSPILREQWYRNNVFNNLVFSRRNFYKSNFLLNGGEIANASVYQFNISIDQYGVIKIVSIPLNKSTNSVFLDHFAINSSPSQLKNNNESFSHIYEFNSSYANLVGYNNLSLKLTDYFSNSFLINESILSRKISSGAIVEGDAEQNGQNIRKTVVINDQMPDIKLITIGGVLAIFIIFFLQRRKFF